ncbi:MAG TPA: hypothetical protein VGB73_03590 [Pyrinomonadaceae bacterium]|jgi:hypothetical protein
MRSNHKAGKYERGEASANVRGESAANGAGLTRPRRLLLCLDGVPHELIEAARSRGLFDRFNEAARLLSPFPTMTNVALSTMLGATAPLGYESLYFNRDERRLCGGARKYVGRRTPDKIPSSYMDELDYQEPLPFEFLVYVAPETIWRADMRRFRERFRAAPAHRDFFAFLKGTDGLLHIRGARRLDVALQSLDRILREIQDHCGAETEIVLFSDHGMNLQDNRRINLATHLRAEGYEVADNLSAPQRGKGRRRSVAVPAFGLCGYAALYCAEETDAGGVADALSTLEGVDFSIRREGSEAVVVRGERGAARIHRAKKNVETTSDRNRRGDEDAGEPEGDREPFIYRYEQLDGDPLQLSGVVADLQHEGRLDERGFASDTDWLERTARHIYPDPLANLFDALHAPRVQHTADLLLSLHDGYYYGASLFSRLARLRATHGNALRPSTTAFLMSTHRNLPPFVRANEARPLLRE